MPKTFTTPLTALVLLFLPACLFADDRLDQILEELTALRQQVDALEQRLDNLEAQGIVPNTIPSSAASAEKEEKKNWFDAMRVELKKAEVRASGAWTVAATWDSLEKGMEEEDVITLLGEPTTRKFSVRKDTDEIFYYRGDLEGTGEQLEGEVRIYKGKVRRFVVPDFSETE